MTLGRYTVQVQPSHTRYFQLISEGDDSSLSWATHNCSSSNTTNANVLISTSQTAYCDFIIAILSSNQQEPLSSTTYEHTALSWRIDSEVHMEG